LLPYLAIVAMVLIVLMSVGCGQSVEPIKIDNQSKSSDALALAMVESSLEALGADSKLLQEFTLHMLSTPGSACGVQACTRPESEEILAVFEVLSDSTIAWGVCHEITHIYLHDGSHQQWSEFAKCDAVEDKFR
jgi:hypothetical protein